MEEGGGSLMRGTGTALERWDSNGFIQIDRSISLGREERKGSNQFERDQHHGLVCGAGTPRSQRDQEEQEGTASWDVAWL